MVFNERVPSTPVAQALNAVMTTGPMLEYLEQLSGQRVSVHRAIGGYNEYHAPGYLGLHEDVSTNRLQTVRVPFQDDRLYRLNALLFLNDLDEGHLELWETDQATRKPERPSALITPRANRLVLGHMCSGA